MPVIQRGEHLAHDIEDVTPVVLGTFDRTNMILLFWQECTRRQNKQLPKATEKTLISNGLE
jgi:hypothetical protein